MISKRKHRRYLCRLPVIVSLKEGTTHTLVPSNVSIGGAFFDHPIAFSINAKIDKVEIHLPDSIIVPLSVSAALRRHRFSGESRRGFVLQWQIEPSDMAKLEWALKAHAQEPSLDKKVDYIIAEQSSLLASIGDLEKGKRDGMRFIFALILAYMGFLVSPYKFFPDLTREMAAVYALTGIWISLALIFYCDRFLRFLGTSFRKKALYYKALSLNRAYIFANDGEYYKSTVFPVGLRYDDARTWAYSDNPNARRKEYHVQRFEYAYFTTLYFLFIELLFVLGLYYFISIVLRAGAGEDFVVGERLNLFSWNYYSWALAAFSIFVFLWIQFIGNECAHYQRSIWEAKRIDVWRPNPRFSAEAFWKKRYLKLPSKVLLVSVFSYSLSGFLVLIPAIRQQRTLWTHLYAPWTVVGLAVLFLAAKIVYIFVLVSEERSKKSELSSNYSYAGPLAEDDDD